MCDMSTWGWGRGCWGDFSRADWWKTLSTVPASWISLPVQLFPLREWNKVYQLTSNYNYKLVWLYFMVHFSISALDGRDYSIWIFFFVSRRTYAMAPHLKCLSQTVQIRGHCTCFCADLTRLTPSAHSHLKPCNLFSECFNSVHVCFQACLEVFIG